MKDKPNLTDGNKREGLFKGNSKFKLEGKFKNVPVEWDSRILYRKISDLGEYEVLYEVWSWDGTTGSSYIFANEDVAELSDAELEALVRTSGLLKDDESITFTRGDKGFTYVNFNFEYD